MDSETGMPPLPSLPHACCGQVSRDQTAAPVVVKPEGTPCSANEPQAPVSSAKPAEYCCHCDGHCKEIHWKNDTLLYQVFSPGPGTARMMARALEFVDFNLALPIRHQRATLGVPTP